MVPSYEDRISVPTPEGVVLETPLAGLGSRVHAAIVDGLIRTALGIGLFFVAAFLAGMAGASESTLPFVVVLGILGAVFVTFGYDAVFEMRWSGRSPGKKSAGIRVVKQSGAPIGGREVAIRTVMRLVDALPTAYMTGAVSVLLDKHNRRLGDIAAGTVVVREHAEVVKGETAVPRLREEYTADLDTWDVSLVTADELATVRRFLERRATLLPGARAKLAEDLAERLMGKVSGPRGHVDNELFLVQVLEAKAARATGATRPDDAPGPEPDGGPRGRFQ